MNQVTTAPVRMSSQEIADLTGKRHRDVTRDIKKMLSELDGANLRDVVFGNDARGYTAYILLPRREVEILLTGYSVPLRAKVIDRMHQLEEALREPPKPAQPQTYLSALQELVAAVAAQEELQKQNMALAENVVRLLPSAQVGEAVGRRLSLGLPICTIGACRPTWPR